VPRRPSFKVSTSAISTPSATIAPLATLPLPDAVHISLSCLVFLTTSSRFRSSPISLNLIHTISDIPDLFDAQTLPFPASTLASLLPAAL
jgi:hypothetical protein